MTGAAPQTAPPAHYDETRHTDGGVRREWTALLSHITAYSPDQLASRQREIDRQFRANGLAYDPAAGGNPSGRALDTIPMVFDEAAWNALVHGVQQRARLKAALFRDIYGAQRLVSEGVLPAEMLYAHRGYLRDLVSSEASTPAMLPLPLFSCDLRRSVTGDWLALRERSQYPTGLGYTLENRMVLSRVLPSAFKSYRVRRVAAFFRRLQQTVAAQVSSNAQCVMLCHASTHPDYFEYAWLSKYLGYAMVEPADLTVRDGLVFLKTITGLQPVRTVLRFMDDDTVDPLVEGKVVGGGVPGLVDAARRGGVTVINPLGAGVLDNTALESILPALCEALLGETLAVAAPRTLWLGDAAQRATALNDASGFDFWSINAPEDVFSPRALDEAAWRARVAVLENNPAEYVAQAPLAASFAPSLLGTEMVSRALTLRTFHIADDAGGYESLPGGWCLLHDSPTVETGTAPDVACKDTWVLAADFIDEDTLLQPRDSEPVRAETGDLPSRLAENVFWLGRYSERLDSVLRLVRTTLNALLDDDRPRDISLSTPGMQGLLRATTAATGTAPGFLGRGAKRRMAQPDRELLSLLQDATRVGTLANALQQLHSSATALNDRLSGEQVRVFNRLRDTQGLLDTLALPADFSSHDEHLGNTLHVLDELLLLTAASTGLGHENITHSDDWLFTQLGRRIERANQIAVTVAAALSSDRYNARLMENLLRLFDSVMTYRSRYRSDLDLRRVVQLLLLDEINPRSLAYQLAAAHDVIERLPERRAVAGHDALGKLAIAAVSQVRLADPNRLLSDDRDNWQSLQKFLKGVQDLTESMADAINGVYFSHTEASRSFGLNRLPIGNMARSALPPQRDDAR
ncbi:MAG: circularly permuted type 2 ATP-grasp protein [Pseudomonadota bacterium]